MKGNRASLMTPALLTRMSAPPQSVVTRSARALTSSGFRTSTATANAWPPALRISSAVACARTRSLRHVRTVRAPAEASSREIALPIPRDPPVTTAVLMGFASTGPDYIHSAPDSIQRAGRVTARGPIDPARHLREHLARAGLEEDPAPIGHHGLARLL